MPNLVLKEGTAIGAMSLVTQSTEDWGIYVGIPAKKIKEREKGLLNFVKDYE
jgi:galactoside O-acetyltransferase